MGTVKVRGRGVDPASPEFREGWQQILDRIPLDYHKSSDPRTQFCYEAGRHFGIWIATAHPNVTMENSYDDSDYPRMSLNILLTQALAANIVL